MAYKVKYPPYRHGSVDLAGACMILGDGQDHPMPTDKVIALAQAGTIPVHKDCYKSIQNGDSFHTKSGYVTGGIFWYFPRKELEEYRGMLENSEESHNERMLRLNLEEISGIRDYLLQQEKKRQDEHHQIIVELGNMHIKLANLSELGAMKVLTETGIKQLQEIKEALFKAALAHSGVPNTPEENKG